MNILFLQDDFPPESKGGAGNMAATLALALSQKGHRVTIIAATQTKSNEGMGQWKNITVHRIYSDYHERWRGYRSLYNWQTVSKVRHLMAELGPEVVHAHNIHYHLSYHCLALARRHAKKVVLTAHDEMLFHYGKFYECIDSGDYVVHWWQLARRFKRRWNPLRNLVIRHYVRDIPIVSLSEAHKHMLLANGFESTAIFNGVDPHNEPVSPAAIAEFKRTHGLEGKKVALFAGRISRLKGAQTVRRAMERVRETLPNATLLIAGAIGQAPHEVYSGWLTAQDMLVAYGVSDVVLFPSIYFDPFGLVNLEAMASRKPVVATCFGGASEIVLDGKTGYVVDPRDTKHFAARITELLLDSQKAARLGAAGHERLLEYFTASHMAERYLEMYTLRNDQR